MTDCQIHYLESCKLRQLVLAGVGSVAEWLGCAAVAAAVPAAGAGEKPGPPQPSQSGTGCSAAMLGQCRGRLYFVPDNTAVVQAGRRAGSVEGSEEAAVAGPGKLTVRAMPDPDSSFNTDRLESLQVGWAVVV